MAVKKEKKQAPIVAEKNQRRNSKKKKRQLTAERKNQRRNSKKKKIGQRNIETHGKAELPNQWNCKKKRIHCCGKKKDQTLQKIKTAT